MGFVPEIHGVCDKRFTAIRDAFVSNFEQDREIGAAVAVMKDGVLLVDLWAGWKDRAGTQPWERDTVVQVFSTSKILLSICMLILADRGQLDLDAPVSRYWPEFGQGGKDKVTVLEAITHRAGVPGFRPAAAYTDLHDWDATVARIAAMPHWFNGEPVLCYHPTTYGFLLGKILQCIDGRDIATFARAEVSGPIGADFQLAPIDEATFRRAAELNFLPPEPAHEMPGPITAEIMDSIGPGNPMTPEHVRALNPASNCFANARSIAQICSVYAEGGTTAGRRILSEHWAREAGREQASGDDLFIGPIRYGMGLGIDNPDFPTPMPNAFHWGGYGGSWGLMDPDTRVSFGYAQNNLDYGGGNISPRIKDFHQALTEILPGLP